jgi:hypothetical protein
MRDLKSEILAATDGGLLILKKIYPQIPINTKKKFRIRQPDDDKDMSASLWNNNGIWHLRDFGKSGKEGNAIDHYMMHNNVDFSTAIKMLAEDLSLINPSYNRQGTNAKNILHVAEKELVLKKFSKEELVYFGHNISSQLLNRYDIQSLESYGKLKSKADYYLFLYGPFNNGDSIWCKINRPSEKKTRFFQVGIRPSDFIFGFKQLPNYTSEIFITGGEKDVVSLASKGYYAVSFNSETARISDKQISLLRSKCKTLYVLYDIDEGGVNSATEIIDKYSFIVKVTLPQALKNYKDFRGNQSNDISEYFRYFSKEQFEELIDLATSSDNICLNVDNLFSKVDKDSQKLKMIQTNLVYALQDASIYRYEIEGKSIFIRVKGPILQELTISQIRDFCINEIKVRDKEVELEKILSGSKYYFNHRHLDGLRKKRKVEEFKGRQGSELFFFQGKIWNISSDMIEEESYNSLNEYLWDYQLINWFPVLEKDYFTIKKNGNGDFSFSYQKGYCNFLDFIINTSNIYWNKDSENKTAKDLNEVTYHILSKITGLGYLLHTNKEESMRKAVIATDFVERNIGEEQGGTGKSLVGMALMELVPTHYRGAGQKDFFKDKHILSGIAPQTKLLFFDDAGKDFKPKDVYTLITGIPDVNNKHENVFHLDREQSLKLFITTNHTPQSTGNATDRRFFFMTFSNFYNLKHQPIHDFDKEMFKKDWGYDQWNRFYNFMAQCVKAYLKFGLVEAPFESVRTNRLRSSINQPFLEWAEENEDLFVGQKIYRPDFDKPFMASLSEYERRNMSTRIIKESLKQYCELKGLLFNPSKKGKNIKQNSKEYYEIQLPEGGTNGKR